LTGKNNALKGGKDFMDVRPTGQREEVTSTKGKGGCYRRRGAPPWWWFKPGRGTGGGFDTFGSLHRVGGDFSG